MIDSVARKLTLRLCKGLSLPAEEYNRVTAGLSASNKQSAYRDGVGLPFADAGGKIPFSVRLTDPDNPMKLCAHCGKAFIARRADSRFCSVECRSKARKRD